MKALILVFIVISNSYADSFPSDFKWGVATSAHQIEGNNVDSDWWAFEQVPGNIHHGDVSGEAAGHWNRLEEDTKLIKKLGAGLYRFSLEWAKIEPVQGQFNQKAIEHYKRELELLKEQGITSMVTLNHFTLPKWFADKGGWVNRESIAHFYDYARFVEKELGKQLGLIVTINEPLVVLAGGYLNGEFAPGIKDRLDLALKGAEHMLRAHGKVFKYYKSKNINYQLGFAHHMRIFRAKNLINPLDYIAASQLNKLFNWSFRLALKTGRFKAKVGDLKVDESIPEVKGTQDFFGLNYYSRDLVSYAPKTAAGIELSFKKKSPKSDMGWEIYPKGIYKLLKDVHKEFPYLPIYITENGLADAKDTKRKDFLVDHLKYIYKAIKKGVPVKGYCHWSLMDNFEWAHGFGPRFGLYEVDYDTLERKLRGSGKFYREIIRTNGKNILGD